MQGVRGGAGARRRGRLARAIGSRPAERPVMPILWQFQRDQDHASISSVSLPSAGTAEQSSTSSGPIGADTGWG